MTKSLALFLAALGGLGALLALALARWGGPVGLATGLPVGPLVLDVFFLPSAACADQLYGGNLSRIYLFSGLQWPVMAGVEALLLATVRTRSSWGRWLQLGAAFLVPVIPALVLAAPTLRPRILLWCAAWLLVAWFVGAPSVKYFASRTK